MVVMEAYLERELERKHKLEKDIVLDQVILILNFP